MTDNVQTSAIPTSKKITLAGLGLAAISPVALPFTEWAQSNPWLALPLVATWEILLLMAAFAFDVWAEVRPTLVGRAAEATRFWIDCLLSGHRKRYLQDVIYQHRNFDVKGLSTQATFTLELEQVFVDLSIAPIAPHQASADMLRKLPPELREGRHEVWDFLEGIGHGAAKLVLLGAPGSGKTTLVKHIALTFAHGRSPKPRLRASRNLPILLFLREHTEAISSNPDAKLSELVAEYQKEKRQVDIPANWFDDQLRRKRCLVMLDGLDEVADPEVRKKVAVWADQQMSIQAGTRFIITSRPHAYRDNPLSGVNVLDVRPFTSEQVTDFVHRWYVANEIKSQQRDDRGVRQDASKGARDLLDRLHAAPALSDLAVNPLLLTMIATVHRYRSSLPGRRVELYAEICEVSLGKRQQSKGIQLDLTPAQKQRVLEPLAWKMMVERKREIAAADACKAIKDTLLRVKQQLAPADFLSSVESDSSLLLEKEAGGMYAFAHLTFQEFLAACHAHQNEHRAAGEPDRIGCLIHNVGDGWWAECIRLFAATGDATPILRTCMKKRPLDPEALALALQCMEEAQLKDPALELELDRIVEAGLNEADPGKRKPIAEALLKVRLSRMRRLDESRYIDPELISHAEYQLFIDEERAKGRDRRPVHWTTSRFPEGDGRSPILGLSFLDAVGFCHWLTEREGGQRLFRLPTIEEVETTEPHKGLVAWAVSNGRDSIPGPWPEPFENRQQAIASGETAPSNLAVARLLALARNLDDFVDHKDSSFAKELTMELQYVPTYRLAVDLAFCLRFPGIGGETIDVSTMLNEIKSSFKHSSFTESDNYLSKALDLNMFGTCTLELDIAFALSLARSRAYQFVSENPHVKDDTLLRQRFVHASKLMYEFSGHERFLSVLLAAAQSGGPQDERLSTLISARNLGLSLIFLWELREWIELTPSQQLLAACGEAIGFKGRRWVQSAKPPARYGFGKRSLESAREVVRDLHVAARLAHARMNGTDSPFEALRLVRERVDTEHSAQSIQIETGRVRVRGQGLEVVTGARQ